MTEPVPDARPNSMDGALSPVDLPETERSRSGALRWASVTIATATLALLLGNATSLADWAEGLTPGPAQARLADVTGRWTGLTRTLGIAAPRDALHARWKRAEAARFGDEADAGDEGSSTKR